MHFDKSAEVKGDNSKTCDVIVEHWDPSTKVNFVMNNGIVCTRLKKALLATLVTLAGICIVLRMPSSYWDKSIPTLNPNKTLFVSML